MKKNVDMLLAEQVAGIAAEDKLRAKDQQRTYRLAIICTTILLIVSMICGTIIAVKTIVEQQYALNMQYARFAELMDGAVVMESGDNGIVIKGDNNTAEGGDCYGKTN